MLASVLDGSSYETHYSWLAAAVMGSGVERKPTYFGYAVAA
jgi:hypothetical protein